MTADQTRVGEHTALTLGTALYGMRREKTQRDAEGSRKLVDLRLCGVLSNPPAQTRGRQRSVSLQAGARVCSAMNFAKLSEAPTPRAPLKGSFPLDHFHECSRQQTEYMACLKQTDNDSLRCKTLAQAYLTCRMDRYASGPSHMGKNRRRNCRAQPVVSDLGCWATE